MSLCLRWRRRWRKTSPHAGVWRNIGHTPYPTSLRLGPVLLLWMLLLLHHRLLMLRLSRIPLEQLRSLPYVESTVDDQLPSNPTMFARLRCCLVADATNLAHPRRSLCPVVSALRLQLPTIVFLIVPTTSTWMMRMMICIVVSLRRVPSIVPMRMERHICVRILLLLIVPCHGSTIHAHQDPRTAAAEATIIWVATKQKCKKRHTKLLQELEVTCRRPNGYLEQTESADSA